MKTDFMGYPIPDDDAKPEALAIDLELTQMMASNMGEMRAALEAEGFTQDNATKIIVQILRGNTQP